MFFMKVKKRIIICTVALTLFALACLAGFAACLQGGDLPVMGMAAGKEEGKKIALTFEGEVIIGLTGEIGRAHV